jgi:hypothetical protein
VNFPRPFRALALAASSLLLSSSGAFAQEAPRLAFLKSFVVQNPSLTPPPGARDQSSFGGKWDLGLRDGSPEDNYYPAALLCVRPGALEPQGRGPGFFFPLDEQLGAEYDRGTLSFSGRADSLFWQPQTGWGSEDINQDMTPLLLRSDYQQVDEPSYEFMWQHQTNMPSRGDSIYLNYVFKIPKQSRTLRSDQLRVGRQYFDRGFAADAPRAIGSKLFLWDSGALYSYDDALSSRKRLSSWRLPSSFKATALAVSSDAQTLLLASAGLSISCFRSGDAAPVWTLPGSGPLLISGNAAYALAPDYSAIMVLRLADGKPLSSVKLPRYLPRSPNSFVGARLSGRDCLFLLIPAQSKTLAYEIR